MITIEQYPLLLSNDDANTIYVRNKQEAFLIQFNPCRRPEKDQPGWPIDLIVKFESEEEVTKLIEEAIDPTLADWFDGDNMEAADFAMYIDYGLNPEHYEGILTKYGESYEYKKDK